MVWLHGLSDFLIGTSYMAIAGALAYLVVKARRDLPFPWMYLAFGFFIFSCAWTHFLELWTLWYPIYWVSGATKAITALASLATAVGSFMLLPRALAFIEAAKTRELRRAAEFETIYSRTPVGLCFVDRNMRYVMVNSYLAQINGMTVEQHLGRSIREVVPPIADQIEPLLGRVVETGIPIVNIELHGPSVREPQREHYWLVSVYPVGQNPVIGTDAVVLDITERKEAERTLAEAAVRRQVLFEQSKDGIVVMDGSGRAVECNRSFADMLGCSREEVARQAVWDWDAQWNRAEVLQKVRQVQIAGATFETRHRRRDGTTFDVEISASAAQWSNRTLVYCVCRDISARKTIEAAVRHSQAELEAIYNSTPLMLCLVDQDGVVQRMNHAMATFIREAEEEKEPKGLQPIGCVNALARPGGCGAGPQCQTCQVRLAIVRTLQTGEPCRQLEGKVTLMSSQGRREVLVSVSTAQVRVDGRPKALVCLENITQRKQLEAQFLQAQKMEAVGQLAGGVAHDFNNILASTLLHLGLLRQRPQLPEDVLSSLGELQQETQRAASLTRQLLLFSRREMLQIQMVDLNRIIEGITRMLMRILGEHIELTFVPSAEPLPLQADTGMIEQVVTNLCVNARDAMPRGGPLCLRTQRVAVNEHDARRSAAARPGEFACFSVADKGTGMDQATVQRLFEPFFTTKEPGKGTGLGLATVYGIVHQHLGWVEVESAPGEGSTFRVFLPITERAAEVKPTAKVEKSLTGTETILLVEDEERLRTAAKMTLRLLGYRVLEAANASQALRLWEERSTEIDLLLTDVVMPGGMSGFELAEHLMRDRPNLKVIAVSGYSGDLAKRPEKTGPEVRFLAKPFSPEALAEAVRECLDDANRT